MATRSAPKTKAGKERKVSKVMHEWGQGKLKSGGSGKPVKSQKQAVAIALSESGQAKSRSASRPDILSTADRGSERKRSNSRDRRIANEVSRRVEDGADKARR